MARRERLTYDLGEQPSRGLPWMSLLLLGAVLAVAVALVAWVVVSGRAPEAAPAAGTAASTASSAPASVSPTEAPSASTASASPEQSGSDAAEELTAPEGSAQAATLFVRGWLDRNAKTRAATLSQVSAPALVEQLMLTDASNIPQATPKGPPVLASASTYSAEFTQTLSSGQRIQVYLVAEPTARYRWLATSVDRA